MSGDPTATIRKRALRATVPSPKYFLESPSHAQSTPTKLKRLVSGIEYNRLSSGAAVHRTLRRPRHTSADSRQNQQISHLHHSFLCNTASGCLPHLSLQRRSRKRGSPDCTNPALSGLIPHRHRNSFGANGCLHSPHTRRAPQICCKPLLICIGRGNNGLFAECAFVLRLCA